ncbi:MAG: hypothetical protein MI748_19215 [Opitutales bacterium]|nr:hypothetical protein [Opitutales bacterium]
MKKLKAFLLLLPLSWASLLAQQLGANFNHNPEIIDFDLLEIAEVEWVRATPRIIDYLNGKLQLEDDPGLAKIVEAGERGYQVAFGFRWDFKMHKMRIPTPGSAEEKALFDLEYRILEIVGPHVDLFKLGNEPNLETHREDQQPDESGVIPLVRFTERQLTHVVEKYYANHPELKRPDVYVGSFPRLFMEEEQKNPGVIGMMELVENDSRIAGLAIHLHISRMSQIEDSFEFARKYVTEKPFIIPEFSLHRLYLEKIEEPIAINKAGRDFLKKYGHPGWWKMYDWYTHANSNRVLPQELADLFSTRNWYPDHYLRSYFEAYKKYGVFLATYPLLQQSCPRIMTPDSPCWFLNPILMQITLEKQPDGTPGRNPLVFEDYISI